MWMENDVIEEAKCLVCAIVTKIYQRIFRYFCSLLFLVSICFLWYHFNEIETINVIIGSNGDLSKLSPLLNAMPFVLCHLCGMWFTNLFTLSLCCLRQYRDSDERLAASLCGFSRRNDRSLEGFGANEIKRRRTRRHSFSLYPFIDVTAGAKAY